MRNSGTRITLGRSAALAILLAGGHATAANAATDGTLGATSEGSVDITASVPSLARISGLEDISLLNQDPLTAASAAQDVCVWSNTATRGYTVTASGSGAGNGFTLTNGSATVDYTVEWSAAIGATSGTALTAATASSGLVSGATHQTCAAGPAGSASLIVGISTTELSNMAAGANYTGTLTLLITPQ